MRIRDWSSDVCSSDLGAQPQQVADREAQFGTVERVEMEAAHAPGIELTAHLGGHRRGDELARGRMIVEPFEQPIHPRRDRRAAQDRKSVVEGKSVSVRVYLGGRRILKKKKQRK